MESQLAFFQTIARPLVALMFASAALMGSPGPSTVSLTAVGASFGVRRSLPYAGGLIAGTTAVLLMVAIGVVAVVTSIPYAPRVLGGLSAAYIFYLAYSIAKAPPLEAQTARTSAPSLAGGFLLAVANPKAYLAIAAVFAGTTVAPGHPALDAIVKMAFLTGMIVLIHMGWLLLGASLSRWLRHPVSSRIINLSLAAVLVGTTVLALTRSFRKL
ncbi:LysE family translocator [Pendulispora albinea]|uniref:LysE family translocator n=1 Tax=Pendulispora albinea TaxID=2741071 RepID=A0ABZ2M6S2_9BACT